MRRDEGAATVLVVALVSALVGLLAVLLPVEALLDAHERAATAADAAALAASDTALGVVAGIPCAAAARVATADGAALTACRQQGTEVRVDVAVRVLGLSMPGAARAGPPAADRGAPLRGSPDGSVYGVRDRRPPQHACAADEGGPPCPARRSW